MGFIDLSTRSQRCLEFILFTKHRMFVRDDSEILSVIWYCGPGKHQAR